MRKAPMLINPSGSGMPERLEMKMTFSGVKTFSPLLGSLTQYAFKVNGMYDPDFGLGGNQPNNFDQLMQLYTAYYVKGSKIRLWCASGAGTTPNTVYLTFNVLPYGVSTVTAPALGQYEQISTWTKSKQLIVTPLEGSKSMGVLRNSETYKEFFGGANPAEQQNQGSAAADPPRTFYWIVTCYNTAQASSASATYSGGFNIQIEYDAVFISPRQNIDT